MVCPFDSRMSEKEREMIDHYHDLKVEIQKIWGAKDVGALGGSYQKLDVVGY